MGHRVDPLHLLARGEQSSARTRLPCLGTFDRTDDMLTVRDVVDHLQGVVGKLLLPRFAHRDEVVAPLGLGLGLRPSQDQMGDFWMRLGQPGVTLYAFAFDACRVRFCFQIDFYKYDT